MGLVPGADVMNLAERLLGYLDKDNDQLRKENEVLTQLAHKNKMDYLAALKQRNDAAEEANTDIYIELQEELNTVKDALKKYKEQLGLYRDPYKYAATDKDGTVRLFYSRPVLDNGVWNSLGHSIVDNLYAASNFDYADSLEALL